MSDSDSSDSPDEFFPYENPPRPVSVQNKSLSMYLFLFNWWWWWWWCWGFPPNHVSNEQVYLQGFGFSHECCAPGNIDHLYNPLGELHSRRGGPRTSSEVPHAVVRLSFRRGRQPVVRHRSRHPASSFQADEDCHLLAAHSAEAGQEQCFFLLGFESRTCIVQVSAVRRPLSFFQLSNNESGICNRNHFWTRHCLLPCPARSWTSSTWQRSRQWRKSLKLWKKEL